MLGVIDYLYYKLYKAALKSSLNDIPEFAAFIWLGGVISTNISVAYLYLVKVDILPYVITNPKQGGFFAFVVICVCRVIYNKKRRKIVLEKYSQETNKERIKGNIIVFTYVIVSFLLIYAVAFYKPGKL